MKKNLLLFVVLFTTSTLTFAYDDRPVEPASLPNIVKEFVNIHFKESKITYATRDWDEFDVYLQNAKIEFRTDGTWKEVKMYGVTIPKSIINLLPEKIKIYLNHNFNEIGVVEVQKKHYKYEIKLSSGLEMEFDKDGTFMRYDD